MLIHFLFLHAGILFFVFQFIMFISVLSFKFRFRNIECKLINISNSVNYNDNIGRYIDTTLIYTIHNDKNITVSKKIFYGEDYLCEFDKFYYKYGQINKSYPCSIQFNKTNYVYLNNPEKSLIKFQFMIKVICFLFIFILIGLYLCLHHHEKLFYTKVLHDEDEMEVLS